MTTIVYKNGVLAADRQINWKNKIFAQATKIFINQNIAYGMCGTITACGEFAKFINGFEFDKEIFHKEDHKDFDAIVIDVKTREVSIYDTSLIKETMEAEFFCLGSGGDIAIGALLMGATPRQAIECAAKIDQSTGDQINEIYLE
jgi:hypothetical protein